MTLPTNDSPDEYGDVFKAFNNQYYAGYNKGTKRTFNSGNNALMAGHVNLGNKLPPLDYWLHKFNCQRPPGIFYDRNRPYVTGHKAIGYVDLLRGEDQNLCRSYMTKTTDIAIRKFYNYADSLDLNAAVSLGEAPKTFGLISDTAVRIYRTMRSLKRFDVSGALGELGLGQGGKHAKGLYRKANNLKKRGEIGKAADFMGNTWLELKYGWTPLLNDIENAAAALSKDWEADPTSIRLRTKGKLVPTIVNLDSPWSTTKGRVVTSSALVSTILVVDLTIHDAELRARSNLGLSAVSSVAWELMPWSFVIDWLYPVGDFIAADTALDGTTFNSGYHTTRVYLDLTAHVEKVGSYTTELVESMEYLLIERKVLHAPPPSTRILSAKSVNGLLNLDKLGTSLALLNSLRK